MGYCMSQLDKDNKQWFKMDKSKNTLLSISVSDGNIRGVSDSSVEFQYPISVFVGENGSGKSTYLSLIACAFHNDTTFCSFNRIRSNNKRSCFYYTYGDFFTFAPMETGISGIKIISKYLSNTGEKEDVRKKKPSGKWNDFVSRPKRVVSFLGINRILPPSESMPHKHYYKSFSSNSILDKKQLNDLKNYLSKIFGRNYSDIDILSHNTYRLFSAERSSTKYSGFNMGAGENAVIELLVEIMSSGKGSLIVIDEIELGLHAKAQKELIKVLKEICKENHCQIICSTHSKIILESLPEEARFYIKRDDSHTEILSQITPEFAFGQLIGETSGELDVFVEDNVGEQFLINLLSKDIRERINIYQIGSSEAILRQMAAHYREHKYNYIAFQDGDKRSERASSIEKIKHYLEDRYYHSQDNFQKMMESRLCFLPGDSWPERVIVEGVNKDNNQSNITALSNCWCVSDSDVKTVLENALSADKHNEIFEIAKNLHLSEDTIRTDMIRQYRINNNTASNKIEESIRYLLEDNL